MIGDDLKRMQDGFLEGGKSILRERGRLTPVGFIVTLHKHVDKIFESGWGLEIIDWLVYKASAQSVRANAWRTP